MLAWEPYVEAKALRARGWSISAIARHLDINWRTAKRYVVGEAKPGARRRPAVEGPFERFAEYARLRLADDPHLWASTLHDELVELGYDGSYPTLTRALRARKLRPHCEPCHAVRGRDRAIIEHPPGEETQWDWLHLPDPPESWGWGTTAHLLVGSLAHSSQWRAVLASSEEQPYLIEALDGVLRRLGGVSDYWRFDRMSTVCDPGSGRLSVSFAPVLAHYDAGYRVCPAAVGTGKGWWRRPTTAPRSAGGAPWPTSCPRPKHRPAWTGSAPGSVTAAPGAGRTGPAPRWPGWPKTRACARRRRHRSPPS